MIWTEPKPEMVRIEEDLGETLLPDEIFPKKTVNSPCLIAVRGLVFGNITPNGLSRLCPRAANNQSSSCSLEKFTGGRTLEVAPYEKQFCCTF